MAIASLISAGELAATIQSRFVNQIFEVALVSSGGAAYNPELSNDVEFMEQEVAVGTGGYSRQTFRYEFSDLAPYSDSGIGLATKAAVFPHDGSATTISFSHVVLLRGNGNVTLASSVPPTFPTNSGGDTMVDGFYAGLPTVTNNAGAGCTLNVTIANNGANGASDYTIEIDDPGIGYEVGDQLEITPAVLVAAGACGVDLGSLTTLAQAVQTTNNQIVSASPTASPVVLGNGNEAVFYFNTKLFGFADADG